MKNSNPHQNYSVEEICMHPNKMIQVIDSIVGCETTVVECMDCGKILTEPKTDC